MTVRLIAYQVKGEPEPARLVTHLVDPGEVAARELALLYHERWEAEVSYDEAKVHLQTVRHGKQHTEFRSKSPDLVEQEFWAMLSTYSLVRELMVDAGRVHGIPPREISFVDSLEVTGLTLAEVHAAPDRRLRYLHRRLLADIAECRLDRPRRPRVYDRVVKVKASRYAAKRAHHRQRTRDIEIGVYHVTCVNTVNSVNAVHTIRLAAASELAAEPRGGGPRVARAPRISARRRA